MSIFDVPNKLSPFSEWTLTEILIWFIPDEEDSDEVLVKYDDDGDEVMEPISTVLKRLLPDLHTDNDKPLNREYLLSKRRSMKTFLLKQSKNPKTTVWELTIVQKTADIIEFLCHFFERRSEFDINIWTLEEIRACVSEQEILVKNFPNTESLFRFNSWDGKWGNYYQFEMSIRNKLTELNLSFLIDPSVEKSRLEAATLLNMALYKSINMAIKNTAVSRSDIPLYMNFKAQKGKALGVIF